MSAIFNSGTLKFAEEVVKKADGDADSIWSSLVKLSRILLKIDELALIIWPFAKNGKVYFNRRGAREVSCVPLEVYVVPGIEPNILLTSTSKATFSRQLLLHLGGERTENTIFYLNKNREGYLVLVGGTSRKPRYVQQVIGQFLTELLGIILEKDEIERQASFLHQSIESLIKTSQVMLDTLDFENVLAEINDAVKNIVGAQGAGFLLYDEKNQRLVLQKPAFGVQDEEVIATYRVPLAEGGNAVNVFKSKQPYWSNNVPEDPKIIQRLARLFKVRNLITVPVIVNDKCIGVFHCVSFSSYYGITINRNKEEKAGWDNRLFSSFVPFAGRIFEC